jgi:Regulator of chromosome condensation (RCC1) repeat
MRRIKSVTHSSRFSHSRLLYTQGCGVFGALGHGDKLLDEILFRNVGLSGSNKIVKVKQVSSGWAHSAAVTSEGSLIVFGRPYDDLAIKTINRIKSVSPIAGRFYGNNSLSYYEPVFSTNDCHTLIGMIVFAIIEGAMSSRFGGHDEVSYGTPQFVDGIDGATSAHCSIGLTGTSYFAFKLLAFFT